MELLIMFSGLSIGIWITFKSDASPSLNRVFGLEMENLAVAGFHKSSHGPLYYVRIEISNKNQNKLKNRVPRENPLAIGAKKRTNRHGK